MNSPSSPNPGTFPASRAVKLSVIVRVGEVNSEESACALRASAFIAFRRTSRRINE